MATYIHVYDAAAPGGHYSHAVKGAGLVFVSGQLPIDPVAGRLQKASFEDQARCALDNVFRALDAAGSAPERLLKVNVYITDIGNWPAFDQIYKERLGSCQPARAVIPVPELHYGFLIEIDAVAEA